MIVNVSRLHEHARDVDELVVAECLRRSCTRSEARKHLLFELNLRPVVASNERWCCGANLPLNFTRDLEEAAFEIVSKFKRRSTHEKKAYDAAVRLFLSWAPEWAWAQNREICETALIALALDPEADILMDSSEARLWYSRRPSFHLPTFVLHQMVDVVVKACSEHQHWEAIDERVNRLLDLGRASKYDHALGMVLAGMDDDIFEE
ncbi:MAG: hypothetical protein KF902_07775 [Phycisphaeraceae bacterium]|nr:hypothetical protein [Phycisphaeraceae bacterium]